MANLILSEVLEVMHYDPLTGHLLWTQRRGKAIPGRQAGTIDKDGYLQAVVFGKPVKVHRLAWFMYYGDWPDGEIDHINGDKQDNSIKNLRVVTRQENNQNIRKVASTSKSGLLGAKLDRWGGYNAVIRHGGKQIWIGRFKTAEESHEAYMKKKRELHHGCTF